MNGFLDPGVTGRVPANWEEPARLRPHPQVLADAGFTVAGHEEFAVGHRWRVPELAGFIWLTSFLPAAVLGDQGAAFDADLGQPWARSPRTVSSPRP